MRYDLELQTPFSLNSSAKIVKNEKEKAIQKVAKQGDVMDLMIVEEKTKVKLAHQIF